MAVSDFPLFAESFIKAPTWKDVGTDHIWGLTPTGADVCLYLGITVEPSKYGPPFLTRPDINQVAVMMGEYVDVFCPDMPPEAAPHFTFGPDAYPLLG
jgi:hypothetical protein